ncbi:hypothetical protein AKJ09_09326 [Labilithrix luteola]|uniref:Uncharacterized protein n=1 Tax=Labilithrix luteola TaxID=1391654 RepID=A0A0K1QAA1_9BACT|nr:hypothetical protein AKJ09_09326 [Labilithrix luteola]
MADSRKRDHEWGSLSHRRDGPRVISTAYRNDSFPCANERYLVRNSRVGIRNS